MKYHIYENRGTGGGADRAAAREKAERQAREAFYAKTPKPHAPYSRQIFREAARGHARNVRATERQVSGRPTMQENSDQKRARTCTKVMERARKGRGW